MLRPNIPKFEDVEYPRIDPVADGVHRPFWSVMIPTYNCNQYLEQALNSVLQQDPGPNEMQIEVIDDCSTENDPKAIIEEIGHNRVSFYQQPRNVGIGGNWNTCIKRAQGHWVHILHQDDIVLPMFYSQLEETLKRETTIGAAFCRHIYIDENGHWQSISPLERREPGILSNWLERIAVVQRIQTPSIVVRRIVYEELGGFHAKMYYALDWEMWKRIAVYYPVWYEPQPLACFRLHSSSATSRLVKSGADICDMRRSIEISRAYLPDAIADGLSHKAREHYALYALGTARRMLSMRDIAGAIAQITEALKCSQSARVMGSLVSLFVGGGTRWIWRKVHTGSVNHL